MAERFHLGVARFIRRLLIFAVVGLAIYVSSMRVLLNQISENREWILTQFNTALPVAIQSRELSGQLLGFAPVLRAQGIELHLAEAENAPVRLGAVSVTLDPWASLLALEPRFSEAKFDNLHIRVGVSTQTGELKAPKLNLEQFSRNFSVVSISNAQILLVNEAGASTTLTAHAELRRVGSSRQIVAKAQQGEGVVISMIGRGEGNPFNPRQFQGELSGALLMADTAPLADVFGKKLDVRGSAQFWYESDEGNPELTTALDLDSVAWRFNEHQVAFEDINARVLTRFLKERWDIFGEKISITADTTIFSLPRFAAQLTPDEFTLTTDSFIVDTADDVIVASGLLPEKASDIIASLSPSGLIEGLSISLGRGESLTWSAAALVHDASTQPVLGVPGLYGIDAWLEGTQDGASAWIATDQFGLDLPRVYAEPIWFPSVTGRLQGSWQRDAMFLHDGLLAVDAGEHKAGVQFGIDIPFSQESDVALAMNLAVGGRDIPVDIRARYIPERIPEELDRWLARAIIGGTADEVAFAWRGDLLNYGEPVQTMQIALTPRDAEIQFDPAWPNLSQVNGTFRLDDREIEVDVASAEMRGATVKHASVGVSITSDNIPLSVKALASHDAAGALALLKETPVAAGLEVLIDDVEASGSVDVGLDLTLDIKHLDQPPSVVLGIDIGDTKLASRSLKLELDEVSGRLEFESGQGFFDRGLKASLFGQPVGIAINQKIAQGQTDAIFAGRFDVDVTAKDFNRWLMPSIALPIDGQAPVAVTVIAGSVSEVKVASNLQGVSIDLPVPAKKTAEESTPFELKMALTDNAPMEWFWWNRGVGRLYRDGASLIGATVDLTPRANWLSLPPLANENSVQVTGQLPTLDISAWLAAGAALATDRDVEFTPPALNVVGLQVEDTKLGDTSLGAVRFDLRSIDGWDLVGIHSPWLDGVLALASESDNSALVVNQFNFDLMPEFAVLPSEEAIEPTNVSAANTGSVSVGPPNLKVPLRVVIADIVRKEQHLGSFSFDVESDGKLLVADKFLGKIANIEFSEETRLDWHWSESGGALTEINLSARFRDLGKVFDDLAVERALLSRSGKVGAFLSWPASPSEVNANIVSGMVDVDIRKGSFLPVPSSATGLLRLISLFNLADLLGRANISQLFDAGVAFESAKGHIELNDGIIDVPDFKINGSGGNFTFDSRLDLLQQTIDGELTVTLPLVNNIPWVAALVGGLPVAAGAYVISQVFEDQMNKLSSGVYAITGDLNQPDVKFVRVFDAKTKIDRESAPVKDEVEP